MALRRRAKKLTTMMTSVDRRLRAVEFNSAPSGISIAQVSNVVSNAISLIPPNTYGNVAITSPDSPIGLHNITQVVYYSPNAYIKGKAADTAWIVVHTSTDHGFTTADIGKKKVTVSGLGVFNGDLELAPAWGVPNTTTLRLVTPFKIYTQYGATQVYNYPVTDAIVQKSSTFTDATLYFGGLYNMNLVKGDVIYVNGVGTAFDGTFVITEAGVSTANGNKKYIKYKFLTKQSTQNTTPTTATGTISPTLHKYAAIGDTWIDSSKTPPITYYWNGAGWTNNIADIPAGTIIKDGIAPAAVGNLAATTEGYTDPKTYASVSRVHLTWEAPTLNDDGSALTNLAGYKVERKDTNTGLWIQVDDRVDNDTDSIIDGLRRNTEFEFSVTPYDSAKEFGLRSTVTIITGSAASALTGLSAPTLVTKLGTVSVTWDGKDENGAVPAPGIDHIEVHASKTAAFTPSSATFQGNMKGSSTDKYVIAGLDYATYYFKFVAVDTTGNKFASTLESHILIKSLVNTDVIANTLTTWPFAGQVVNINAIANGSINVQHLLPNAVTQNAIAANAVAANQIAAGAVVAGKLGVGAVTANTIAALSITAGKIAANTITADQISAGYVNTIVLRADQISAGFLQADSYVGIGSSTQGIILDGATSAISIAAGGSNVAHMVPLNTGGSAYGLLLHGGATPDSTGNSYPQLFMNTMGSGFLQLATYDAKVTVDSSGVSLVGPFVVLGDDLYPSAGNVRSSYIYTATSSLAYNMHIEGSGNNYRIYRSTYTSSRELKMDIRELTFDTSAFININPIKFKYIPGILRQEEADWDIIGFIAEDFIDAGFEDELISHPNEKGIEAGEHMELRYDKMYMFLHKVVQEQQERIATLEAAVSELQNRP